WFTGGRIDRKKFHLRARGNIALFLNPARSVSFPGSQPPVRIDLYSVKTIHCLAGLPNNQAAFFSSTSYPRSRNRLI
ncbi:MAG: hypothetical protein Q7J31_02595, partial [Syntrophales bacterium]|nr:hypothetical protein [Syntrophales bacterium]